MSFSEVFKEIRNKSGETFRSLSEKIDMAHTYINRIEKGETPPSKNFIDKILKVYPEYEKELVQAYLEELLPENIAERVIKDNTLLLKDGTDKALLNYLIENATKEERKAVLELMVLQRELAARKTGTYESRKDELEEIKKEIEKL